MLRSFDTANDDLGHELAITAYKHFTVRQHALVPADVQHYKIPLGIHGDDLPANPARNVTT